jgi:hypothetical protein
MLKDLIIVPNFFDNPNEIVEIAKQQKYYNVIDHPEDKDSRVSWGGFRTERLDYIVDSNINKIIKETIINKIIKSDVPDQTKTSVSYWGHSFFHYFTNEYKAESKNLHKDSGLYAGVVYLNEISLEETSKHGTIIFNKQKDEFVMPYEFNTAIFYRSDFMHAPLNGFGNDVNDARLSLCFFIEELNFNLHRNTLNTL